MKKQTSSGPRFFKPATKAKAKKAAGRKFEMFIERLSDEGRGVGFDQGKAVFVGGTLPNEKILVRVIDEKRTTLEAELVDLIEPSSQRIDPKCPLFGRCGGCQLQMLDDSAQLAFKQQMLERLLKTLPRISSLQWQPALTATPWHYRHRARLAVTAIDGQPAIGFKGTNSHQVIPIPTCPVLDERLQPLLTQLPLWLSQLEQWRRIEELLIAVDADGVLALDWNAQRAFPNADAEKLQALATEAKVVVGNQATLRYTAPQVQGDFAFSVRDFTQINPAINDQLAARVQQWLEPTASDDIVDLFCGLGNFTLPLARHVKSISGYESSYTMVERAQSNAKNAACANAEFHALDLFTSSDKLPATFNKALLDPPRAGAKSVCEQLVKSKVLQTIVYVSCNPQTLVRDLAILIEGGFTLKQAALVEMFPQTGHAETVVQLVRG